MRLYYRKISKNKNFHRNFCVPLFNKPPCFSDVFFMPNYLILPNNLILIKKNKFRLTLPNSTKFRHVKFRHVTNSAPAKKFVGNKKSVFSALIQINIFHSYSENEKFFCFDFDWIFKRLLRKIYRWLGGMSKLGSLYAVPLLDLCGWRTMSPKKRR